MSYNLYINSTIYHPSTISATNVAQRIYGVDWSFLPNNKQFKVSFDYASGRGQLNPDQTGYIVMNLNNSSNVTNSKIVEFQSTNIIGFFMPVMGSTRNSAGIPSDISMIANQNDNPPFILSSNSSLNSLLEVLLYNLDGTQFVMPLNKNYQMTLHFEPF